MMVFSSDSTSTNQKLIDLLTLIDNAFNFDEIKNIEISDISDDSRNVVNGALFIARAGHDVHGERFISDAIKNGAVAILRQSSLANSISEIKWIATAINKSIPEIIMPFENKETSKLAVAFYKDPSKQLQVTGITGTNGKTSSAVILANILSQKQKSGFIGTIGYGEINALQESSNNTPSNTTKGVVENQKIFSEMYGSGVKHVVMEVSSHALTQHRIDGVDINCAVFTNLTHDHLDYHQTFEKYGEAKLALFQLSSLQHAVINLDDGFSKQILDVLAEDVNVITYGIDNKKATLIAEIIEFKLNSTVVMFKTNTESIEVDVPLLGKFNISNLLAVCGVLISQGLSLMDISKLLPNVQAVKGRMQCLGGHNGLPLVVVDYAHTPDALSNVLETLQLHCSGNLWCIFGCGGDRDKPKRAIMGQIAASIADNVIVTNDNPRTEEPKAIALDIVNGIENTATTEIVLDRKEAIQSTIKKANKSDVILIAGKGHEHYQIIDNIKYHFDDVKTSLDALNSVSIK